MACGKCAERAKLREAARQKRAEQNAAAQAAKAAAEQSKS